MTKKRGEKAEAWAENNARFVLQATHGSDWHTRADMTMRKHVADELRAAFLAGWRAHQRASRKKGRGKK